MHDPYQMYSSLLGMHQNPYAINPLAAGINPLAAIAGPQGVAGGWGQQNPFFGGQHPLQQLAQNPLLGLALQNPLLHQALAQQYLYSQIAPQFGYGQQYGQQYGQPYGQQAGQPFGQQAGQPFGQGISPLAQVANPMLQTGYPLAPQTWIGQQGLGGGAFSHLGRGLQGMSPWGGF